MKPYDIYQSEVVEETMDLWRVESCFSEVTMWDLDWSANQRIIIKTHLTESVDGGERSLSVRSVWFDDKPFMVLYTAGRGERDIEREFITSGPVYRKALAYIVKIADYKVYTQNSRSDDDNLLRLYNHSLSIVDGKMMAKKDRR